MNEFGWPVLDDAALRESSNVPFGVVRVVLSNGDYTIVLDDLNSDYREVELRAYRRERHGWGEIFASDDVGFPDVGQTHGGGWTSSLSGGYGWTFGRERPGTVVNLRYRSESVQVAVDADGWWLCVRETGDEQSDIPFKIG